MKIFDEDNLKMIEFSMNFKVNQQDNLYTNHESAIKHDMYRMLLLGVCIFLMRVGWFASIPFITLFLLNTITHNPVIIGLITGVNFLASCLGGLIGGVFSDRYNSKYLMAISLVFSAILFYAFSGIHQHFYFFMILINSGLGFFAAIFLTANSSYLARMISDKNKMHAYNVRYMVINIAASIGPIVGIWYSIHAPLWMFRSASLLYLTVFIVISIMLPSENKISTANALPNKSFRELTKLITGNKKIIILILLSAIINFAFTQLSTTIPQVLKMRYSDAAILFGALLSINALIIIIIQMPIGILISRYKIKSLKIAYTSSCFIAVAFILFAFLRVQIILEVAVVFFTLGEILYFAVINIIIESISNECKELKGLYFGVANLAMIGGFLGPFFGGFILKYTNEVVLYWGVAIMVISVSILYKKILEK